MIKEKLITQNMKKILCSVLMAFIILSGMNSCKKEKAEMPAPVEGLTANPGNNRAELIFDAPPGAVKGKVFFGGGNFSEFDISDPNTTQKVIVDSLAEQEQVLRVVTINRDGVVSDPRAIKVNVYGSKYVSGLKPRKWADQVTNSSNSLEFRFDNAVDHETGVRIVFTNTAGSIDSVTMAANENSVAVNDIDTTKAYYYYSVYKPVPTAIDDFASPSVDLRTALMLEFKKAAWTIAGSSGEEGTHPAANLIDNNSSTAWHSRAGGSMPQWVTIDMESAKFIDGFYILNHPANGGAPQSLKFEISLDNVGWTTVLQADVAESYMRQRLPLAATVITRYVRVSVLATKDGAATQTRLVEVDAYNIQNISGDNGYVNSTAIALVNAKAPFVGDGSNPFPALGDFRMQKMLGWTHSDNAIVTYDNLGPAFSLFVAPPWGLGEVNNAKIYQSVNLQPGDYVLKIVPGMADGPVDVFGVVSKGASLPDYNNVATDATTISYANLVENQSKAVELRIIITEPTRVNIGFVYNLRSQFAANGTPWTSFKITSLDLAKVE